jgi:TetR/AcrR family transcriptional regulator, transcriptional repressor for nem operon
VDAAGAPKGSFYNHFQSKEQLAADALAIYLANVGVDLDDSSRPPLARLRIQFESLIAYAEKGHFEHGCLMGGLAAFVNESQPHSTGRRRRLHGGDERDCRCAW